MRPDDLDDDELVDRCAFPSCAHETDGGLFCRRHREQLAKLTEDSDDDPRETRRTER
jgi:hypothetical protein